MKGRRSGDQEVAERIKLLTFTELWDLAREFRAQDNGRAFRKALGDLLAPNARMRRSVRCRKADLFSSRKV